MSDQYSYNDPTRRGEHRGAMDYGTSSSNWIWALIVLVALVALIAIGSSSGGVSDGTASELAPPADPAPAQTLDQ